MNNANWMRCSNTPPCPHPDLFHDVEDYDDPSPTCCVSGCFCGHRLPPIEQAGIGEPHAMINKAGDVFYPDSLDDAARFHDWHAARPVNPDAYRQWADHLRTGEPP